MNKLTIEHIAPYLPYDLEVMAGSRRGFYLVPQLNTSKHEREVTVSALMGISQDYYKPILRPLSQLTEVIDHNGGKFVMADFLWSVDESERADYFDYGKVPEYWANCIQQVKENYKRCDYLEICTLAKYHFDFFGLIDKQLAVEKI